MPMKNFTSDPFFHYSECSSTWPKHKKGRRCFTILRRGPNGHFCGLISLEDESRYSIEIAVGAGDQFLQLCFVAITMSSTNVLERVSHFPSRRYAILHRSSKFDDWKSDYIGQLNLEHKRRYQIGVSMLVSRHREQILSLYARPLHL
jgi:hypothetical protein